MRLTTVKTLLQIATACGYTDCVEETWIDGRADFVQKTSMTKLRCRWQRETKHYYQGTAQIIEALQPLIVYTP